MERILFNALLMLVALITMAGCPPKSEVTTRVYPDGKIGRSIQFSYDSAAIDYTILPVPVSPIKWSIKIEMDTTKDKIWNYQMETVYDNFEALSDDYASTDFALNKLDHIIEIKRSFRWFYTFYEYKERYAPIFPTIGSQQFLRPDEMSILKMENPLDHTSFSGLDSAQAAERLAKIEQQYEQYIDYTAATFYIDRQIAAAKSLGFYLGEISGSTIADSLLNIGTDWAFLSEPYIVPSIFGNYFQIDSVQANAMATWIENDEIFTQAMARHEQILLQTYTHRIELPGSIIATNALWREGSLLGWPVKMELVATEELAMYAESKLVNSWAWALSILIMIMSIWLWRIKK